ncbi:MAG TPA: hypothetical protein PLL78_14950 [Fimbriimonadaceae bacterium]|nr:hypothetical protein [Fimbriimonadaceae bacterium]HRJ97971.1 hypothetical protein [Fimbriimonadaceae bacterium]
MEFRPFYEAHRQGDGFILRTPGTPPVVVGSAATLAGVRALVPAGYYLVDIPGSPGCLEAYWPDDIADATMIAGHLPPELIRSIPDEQATSEPIPRT